MAHCNRSVLRRSIHSRAGAITCSVGNPKTTLAQDAGHVKIPDPGAYWKGAGVVGGMHMVVGACSFPESAQLLHRFAEPLLDVPDSHGLILAARREPSAVRRERQGEYIAAMS